MAVLKLAGLVALGATLCACTIDPFVCAGPAQCDWSDGPAVCLEDGDCAYPDDACPSGLRRSPNASTAPGVCVDAVGTSSTTEASSEPSTSIATSSGDDTHTCPPTDWYPDLDLDGFGDASAQAVSACEAPDDSVDNADDCNDADPRVRPDHLQCEDTPGLLAWYRLDEGADASFLLDEASDAVGLPVGAPTLGVEGPFGSAVSYAAHPDSIDISESVTVIAPDGAPLSEGTIELWVRPDPIDASCMEACAHFVLHISDDTGDGYGSNTSDLHIHLDHPEPDTPYRWYAFIDGAFAGGENCILIGPDVEYDRWTHVALRWTADSCALLLDGVSVDSADGVAPSPTWTRGRIGHPPSRPDRAFAGAIDELMVFDEARDNTQIRNDCGQPPCPPT